MEGNSSFQWACVSSLIKVCQFLGNLLQRKCIQIGSVQQSVRSQNNYSTLKETFNFVLTQISVKSRNNL